MGPDTYTPAHDRYPIARLKANRTKIIVYNTEPLAAQRCKSTAWSFLRRAAAAAQNGLEIWDYSNANLKAFHANASRCIAQFGYPKLANAIVNRSIPLRFVPPGWHSSLSYRPQQRRRHHATHAPAADTLFFLGDRRYRSKKCWNVLNRSNWLSNHFASSAQTWGPAAYRSVFAQYAIFANIHRSCGKSGSPLETFRLSLLLSNGATVLSEYADQDDMKAYDSFVHFCDFASLPSCHAKLSSQTERRVLPWWELRKRFAANFSMGEVLSRAGAQSGILASLAMHA